MDAAGWFGFRDCPMFQRIRSEDGLIRLQLRGRLDSASAAGLRPGFAALAASADGDVVLDLAHVVHVDGAGLSAIAFLFRRLVARRRRLTLAGVSGQPLAMIRHLGLESVFGLRAGPPRGRFLDRLGVA
jgi:anti-anti-sigma factor